MKPYSKVKNYSRYYDAFLAFKKIILILIIIFFFLILFNLILFN